jgi:hypothetical protein
MAFNILPPDGFGGFAPRPLGTPRPLIEIGEERSLRREPTAGSSEGSSEPETQRR